MTSRTMAKYTFFTTWLVFLLVSSACTTQPLAMPTEQPNALYLAYGAPTEISEAQLEFRQQAEQNGVQVVFVDNGNLSPSEATEELEIVYIEEGALEQIGRRQLTDWYNQGTVIVGIDIPLGELGEAFNLHARVPDFQEDYKPEGSVIGSWYYSGSTGNVVSSSQGTNFFTSFARLQDVADDKLAPVENPTRLRPDSFTEIYNSIQVSSGMEQQVPDSSAGRSGDLPFRECILSSVGTVSGTARFQEQSIDGAFATFIYDGGATQAVRIQDGAFAAPLIARLCGNTVEFVGFQLTVGDWREYIEPTETTLDLNIELSQALVVPEANVAEHEVLFGTISGMVQQNGQPVPDGTEVTVSISGGLTQTVFTRDGRYTATTLSDLSDGTENYLPVTISVESQTVNVVPSTDDAMQDIDLP